MTVWGTTLHEDQNGIKTAASYDDIGDGTDDWFQWLRTADGGNVALGSTADAVADTGGGSVIALLRSIRDSLVTLRTGNLSGVTRVNAASGNVANAAATATLAATVSVTNYLSGFEVTGAGATAASNILVTVTGLLGGTATYVVAVPAGVTTGITPLICHFDPPLPASAANTAIVVSAAAFGAGNTHAAVAAHGFRI